VIGDAGPEDVRRQIELELADLERRPAPTRPRVGDEIEIEVGGANERVLAEQRDVRRQEEARPATACAPGVTSVSPRSTFASRTAVRRSKWAMKAPRPAPT